MSGADQRFLPDDWSELAPMVDRLLETDPGERRELLNQLAGGDRHRHDSLERLLAECESEFPLLDITAAERFDELLEDEVSRPLPTTVAGRYRIVRKLGSGGMAVVHLAHDFVADSEVALKLIRPELAVTIARERFLREIAIAARLNHPNIMPLLDSGEEEGLPWLVMPFHPGASLRDCLINERVLDPEAALAILTDLARAMEYAHGHGVVHRDIKPDNVMLTGDGAVITDFGIAKAIQLAQGTPDNRRPITEAGTVLGTPSYMSPEQGMGDPEIDHRTDIYSFGCVAHELFTGRPPFVGMSVLHIVADRTKPDAQPIDPASIDAPAPVGRMIVQCLEIDPAERPQSAAELVTVLTSG